MPHFFTVRSTVADASRRKAFDAWYSKEHLPDAVKAFGAVRAWRGWSRTDETVHFAFYEFEDIAEARAAVAGEGIQALIAEFDRHWGTRVKRTREIVEVEDTLPE